MHRHITTIRDGMIFVCFRSRDRKLTSLLVGFLVSMSSMTNLWHGMLSVIPDPIQPNDADAPFSSNSTEQSRSVPILNQSTSSLNIILETVPPTSTAAKQLPWSLSSSDFAICRADGKRDSYVCEGPDYDRFASKLEHFVRMVHRRPNKIGIYFPNMTLRQRSRLQRVPKTWGRRVDNPFPANTTILAVGSSHTRQIFQAMECQYETLRYEDVEGGKTNNTLRRGSYYRIEFTNHAKLHLVTNNALFYSKHWVKYLEDLIEHKVEDLDAIVFGNFNRFIDAMNTTFMELMMEKTAHLEDADFRTIDPPELSDFAQIYSGPIVAHSLMSDWGWGNGQLLLMGHLWQLQETQPERARTIRLVDGRKFIEILGEECSSDDWKKVGICSNDVTKHRCIGSRGGHPDLLVWEILENLHSLWDILKNDSDTKTGRTKRRRKRRKNNV